MAEQPSSDTEFEEYLAGKSSLSKTYQQTPETGPSEFVDKAILKAASEEVKKKHSGGAGGSGKGYNWYVPMALAASVFVAVGVIRIYSTDPAADSEQIAGNGHQSSQTDISAAGKPSPERLLDHISKLVEQSNTEQATEQYKAYKELFPDHEIDFERYPNLKSLANPN